MTRGELKRANELVRQIETTEAAATAYRELAPEKPITVAIGDRINRHPMASQTHEVMLTVAEIGNAIVAAIERRIVMMKAELKDLGIEEG